MLRTILPILLTVCVVLGACSPRPKGVLSAGKLERVLYDIHRADGVLYVQGLSYKTDDNTAKYYEVVLQKHGVTQAQFDSSLVWYTDNPKRFDKIYPRVMERLTEERDALRAYNEALALKTEGKDTIPAVPVTVRTIEEWKALTAKGLPTQWEWDTTEIDTAFIYPYLETLQDSLQLILSPDSSALNLVPTDSIQHQQEPAKADSALNGQVDTLGFGLLQLSPEQVKLSLERMNNIHARP